MTCGVVAVEAVDKDERFSKQFCNELKPRSRNVIWGAKAFDDEMYIAHSHLRDVGISSCSISITVTKRA